METVEADSDCTSSMKEGAECEWHCKAGTKGTGPEGCSVLRRCVVDQGGFFVYWDKPAPVCERVDEGDCSGISEATTITVDDDGSSTVLIILLVLACICCLAMAAGLAYMAMKTMKSSRSSVAEDDEYDTELLPMEEEGEDEVDEEAGEDEEAAEESDEE
jgi:hypothetical protein